MEALKHPVYIFWLCVVLHLIADYTLQGCLADLKQKSWWLGKVYGMEWSKYKHDWCIALLCHALMWSILTFMPVMLIASPLVFSILIVVNTAIHAYVDNLKANKLKINLWVDQIAHLIQILASIGFLWLFLCAR